MKNNKRIISKLAILIGLLIGYYFLNAVFKISIPCMFYKITGFHCPGCGITRLLFSLIKLDFYQAFRYNPLIFILLTIFVLKLIQCIITKRKLIISNKTVTILLIVTILFGIARNIPYFSFLIPTVI